MKNTEAHSKSSEENPKSSLEDTPKTEQMPHKVAIVIGATGLVGSYLITELAADSTWQERQQVTHYQKIICIARRSPMIELNAVVYEVLEDFSQLATFLAELSTRHAFAHADVFSCLGTTHKDAGSKQKFYEVDFEYNHSFAQTCQELGASRLFLLSSISADSQSSSFYLKTKGELEEAVCLLGFEAVYVFRPSLLIGKHKGRVLENIGQSAFGLVKSIYPKYSNSRPIEAERVAAAMCDTALYTTCEAEKVAFIKKYISHQKNGMKVVNNTAMLKMTDDTSL